LYIKKKKLHIVKEQRVLTESLVQ